MVVTDWVSLAVMLFAIRLVRLKSGNSRWLALVSFDPYEAGLSALIGLSKSQPPNQAPTTALFRTIYSHLDNNTVEATNTTGFQSFPVLRSLGR